MIDKELRSTYTVTIGIECHVQLKTTTKLFAPVANDAREAAPNTLISHVCLGMPGALPVLNARAVELAIKAAFALGTKPQKFSKFDRKHYFYPDLPKGYQISQFEEPIILGGYVDIVVDEQPKRINVTRAHMEEDAGKSTHPTGADYSLVDLNRAGTPLLEIVSEPEIHSAAEARAYAQELWLLMRYADVSDANLYYGNMRFDVNVSVSKTDALGIRTETKNLNSFKSVEKAVEYEIDRQISVLEAGGEIVQETRGWDDTTLKTFSQRTKEDAHDYRYFPDPDLPPIVLEDVHIDEVRSTMRLLPTEVRDQLSNLGIDKATVEDIVSVPEIALLVVAIMQASGAEHAKRAVFWLLMKTDEGTIEKMNRLKLEQLISLSELVAGSKLSSTAAKQVFVYMLEKGGKPEEVAKNLNVLQESNESAIAEIVARVISDNPKAAHDVAAGEMKAIGFLTGQVMKQSQGKANPAIAQQIIKQQLGL